MASDDLSISVGEIIAAYQIEANLLSNLLTSYTIPVVLLAGTATVGKSSLINALFGGHQIATVNSITQDQEEITQAIWAGTLKIIDGPSYDQSPQKALDWIEVADVVVHIYNIDVRRSDKELEKHIQASGKPCIPILNKVDQHSKVKQIAFTEKARQNGKQPPVYVSAHRREGLGELIKAICEKLPEASKSTLISQIIEIGEKAQDQRLCNERARKIKNVCEQIIEETGRKVAELGMEAMPLADVHPIFLEYKSMLQNIKQVYLAEKIIEDTMNFPFGSLEQILAFTIVQEIPKFLPGGGQITGSITAQRIARCIGNKAIKFYEQQIPGEQVRREVMDCIQIFQ